MTLDENVSFTNHASGIRLSVCSKLTISRKTNNDVKIYQYDVIVNFFWRFCVFLVKFSYWWKFHVDIITGSRVIRFFLYKRLTRNPEIGNYPAWVSPNTWRLGQVRNAKFGANVFNEMVLNATKFKGYSYYRFWVIKSKPTRRKLPQSTQIRVKRFPISTLKLILKI